MIRLPAATLIGCLALCLSPIAVAQSAGKACTQADLAAVITDMSGKLRKTNVDSQNRLRARLREFAKLKGWSETETEEKGLDLLEDDETRVQDETASHLLAQVDQLGQTSGGAPSCKQIDELKAVAAQLLEVTAAKAAHVSAKLDAELGNARPAIAAPAPVAPAPPEQKRATPVTEAAPPPAKSQTKPAWETQTTTAVRPSDAYVPPPLAPATATPAPLAADLQFSVDDIRAAGRGFFGSISAELAAVIEYMFKSYGRPTGYILGTEGGAALLAGLRYGDGTFVTKFAGERKIYWQGPSVGYDFGLTGSRTMILIYGLSDPDEMLQRFGGVDGSAYLVGGAGVTIMKKGPVILAPIRTGIGLRLGANIGYLKFTTTPRFNPL